MTVEIVELAEGLQGNHERWHCDPECRDPQSQCFCGPARDDRKVSE